MKKLLLVFSIAILSFTLNSQTFDWVKNTPGNELIQSTDQSNNIIIAGYFYDSIQIGSIIHYSNGMSDLFIAKYNSDGDLLWSRSFGNEGPDACIYVDTDMEDNILMNFLLKDTFVVENDTILSPNVNSFYGGLLKLSPEGDCIWLKRIAYSDFTCFHTSKSITDRNNDIYVTGSFDNVNGVFEDTIITSLDKRYTIAKFSSDGSLLWVNSYKSILEIGVDNSNNLVFIYPSGENNTVYIQKNSASGDSLQAKELGFSFSSMHQSDNTLGFDSDNNYYMSAIFWDTLTIGNQTFIEQGTYGQLILKFNPSGNLIWGTQIWSPESSYIQSLIVKNNIISVIGNFRGAVYFNEGSLTFHTKRQSGFLAQFNTNGHLIFKKKFGKEVNTSAKIISVDESIYISGQTGSSAVFDDIIYSGGSFFLAKIDGVLEIEEPTTNDLEVDIYPNPTHDIINIEIPESTSKLFIEIYSIQGELLIKEVQSESEFSIDIKYLAEGNYILKVINGNSIFTEKIVKL